MIIKRNMIHDSPEHVIKILTVPKLISKFNKAPVKIPIGWFICFGGMKGRLDKMFVSFIWKKVTNRKHVNSKSKGNETSPNRSHKYYKAKTNRIMWYNPRTTQEAPWNRTESSETDPQIYKICSTTQIKYLKSVGGNGFTNK